MDREESIALRIRYELANLTPDLRAAYVEAALGEGLLDEQPELAEVVDDPANEAFDRTILDALRLKYVGTRLVEVSSSGAARSA